MISTVIRHEAGRNCATLPCPADACHGESPCSLAVRHIQQRTLCSISVAGLVAALAGYPTEAL